MKFNLKNRPKWLGQHDAEYVEESEEWFEGFEKELRKKLENYVCDGSYECSEVDCQKLMKEILGET